MTSRAKLTIGWVLLGVGLAVAVVQDLLARGGEAPCFSGLSLLSLLFGGVGARVSLTSHDSAQLSPREGEEPPQSPRGPEVGE